LNLLGDDEAALNKKRLCVKKLVDKYHLTTNQIEEAKCAASKANTQLKDKIRAVYKIKGECLTKKYTNGEIAAGAYVTKIQQSALQLQPQ
jgi:hypothetical protein